MKLHPLTAREAELLLNHLDHTAAARELSNQDRLTFRNGFFKLQEIVWNDDKNTDKS